MVGPLRISSLSGLLLGFVGYVSAEFTYFDWDYVIPFSVGLATAPAIYYINQALSKDNKDSNTCNISKDDACGICESEEMYHRLDGKIEEICQAFYQRWIYLRQKKQLVGSRP